MASKPDQKKGFEERGMPPAAPQSNVNPEHAPFNGSRAVDTGDKEAATASAIEAADGGRQAWMSVICCWCAMFVAFGWIQSVGECSTAGVVQPQGPRAALCLTLNRYLPSAL
jgi:hypothetical protein